MGLSRRLPNTNMTEDMHKIKMVFGIIFAVGLGDVATLHFRLSYHDLSSLVNSS